MGLLLQLVDLLEVLLFFTLVLQLVRLDRLLNLFLHVLDLRPGLFVVLENELLVFGDIRLGYIAAEVDPISILLFVLLQVEYHFLLDLLLFLFEFVDFLKEFGFAMSVLDSFLHLFVLLG